MYTRKVKRKAEFCRSYGLVAELRISENFNQTIIGNILQSSIQFI